MRTAERVGDRARPQTPRGERVSNSAVIIYVRNKVPPDALDPSERLPSEIRFGDDAIPTDVVEIAGMRREFAGPPYFISDRMKKAP